MNQARSADTDIVLIGAGIMSATLAVFLKELEPSLRTVCLMRDVGNYSTEETAKQLGLTPQAVRTRLFRGRVKLRERLRDFFFDHAQDRTSAALPEAAFGD